MFSWLLALLFLISALLMSFGYKEIKNLKGIRKGIRILSLAILTIFLCYLAIVVAYWYFFELKGGKLPMILINPIFIWIILSFFVGVDILLFDRKPNQQDNSISIYSNRKSTTILIDQIAYIESRGKFTLVRLMDGNELKNNVTISTWERNLPDFFRIHRSFLINPKYSVLNGQEIVINNEWKLPISRSYKSEVKERFQN